MGKSKKLQALQDSRSKARDAIDASALIGETPSRLPSRPAGVPVRREDAIAEELAAIKEAVAPEPVSPDQRPTPPKPTRRQPHARRAHASSGEPSSPPPQDRDARSSRATPAQPDPEVLHDFLLEHGAKGIRVSKAISVDPVVDDALASMLSPSEQAVYRQLYRLSWCRGLDSCLVGTSELATRCNLNRKTVRVAIEALIEKGYLAFVQSFNEKAAQGTVYRLPTPRSIPLLKTALSSLPILPRFASKTSESSTLPMP